ncbi:type II toxin-antitoxin system ParD family antitoxin [Sphingomonas donggukensis]|uniref:Type II toxin-antitoxin system ParD family antitoxin n=1 Tax=Sphingomonas donggukensis TaxID=2949093 RepID=A0ABY4TUH9_9SPHN|nr:type II toxin-antitoxin system ParD family antitoxin [Sphingomonas donggukensis]URW76058.1 type II toxin-antitoxin system ParD family antitoxin [Sphingomonas donggukensis]
MADRDPEINLGEYTERAARFVAGGAFESIDHVVEAALNALERQQEAFNAIVREKIAEALADPRPSVSMEEAFRQLDEAKARRRA